MELLTNAHFWVGAAFVVFVGVLVMAGVHKFAWQALGEAGAKVQAQLDEAEAVRREAQDLLAQVKSQKVAAEKQAAEMLAAAAEEAKRLGAEAQVKLAEQIERRGQMAERKIAQAEAQATAEVRAAAVDLAAHAAETVLKGRVGAKKGDALIDRGVEQLAAKLG